MDRSLKKAVLSPPKSSADGGSKVEASTPVPTPMQTAGLKHGTQKFDPISRSQKKPNIIRRAWRRLIRKSPKVAEEPEDRTISAHTQVQSIEERVQTAKPQVILQDEISTLDTKANEDSYLDASQSTALSPTLEEDRTSEKADRNFRNIFELSPANKLRQKKKTVQAEAESRRPRSKANEIHRGSSNEGLYRTDLCDSTEVIKGLKTLNAAIDQLAREMANSIPNLSQERQDTLSFAYTLLRLKKIDQADLEVRSVQALLEHLEKHRLQPYLAPNDNSTIFKMMLVPAFRSLLVAGIYSTVLRPYHPSLPQDSDTLLDNLFRILANGSLQEALLMRKLTYKALDTLSKDHGDEYLRSATVKICHLLSVLSTTTLYQDHSLFSQLWIKSVQKLYQQALDWQSLHRIGAVSVSFEVVAPSLTDDVSSKPVRFDGASMQEDLKDGIKGSRAVLSTLAFGLDEIRLGDVEGGGESREKRSVLVKAEVVTSAWLA